MKNRQYFNASHATMIMVAMLVCILDSSRAGNSSTPQVTKVPESVFIIPKDATEGRDPFYPNSLRPYSDGVIVSNPATPAAALQLKALSGAPGHRLAMINNRTMAEGETVDVPTPSGPVKVLCVEIKDTSVVVEVAGKRQELSMRSGK